jgi:hypothetical protein
MDSLGKSDEEKWLAWSKLTPLERWHKSAELLQQYIAAGGSLDPEYDPQDPLNDVFYDENGNLRVYESKPQPR